MSEFYGFLMPVKSKTNVTTFVYNLGSISEGRTLATIPKNQMAE
jgi:hypothetical protein